MLIIPAIAVSDSKPETVYRVEFTEPVKFIRDRVKGIITVGPYVINTDW